MPWLVFFVGLAVVSAMGIVVNVNRLRFEQRIEVEMGALKALAPSNVSRAGHDALPLPVARYFELAVGDRMPVRTLRVQHRGTFRMRPGARPVPIHGTQLFTANPPGFVWSGRIRMAPGVWVDARDMLAAGVGSMRVLLDDTLALVDARGPHLDQGAALRLLAEMPWYPTALFYGGSVTWSPIDATHARATLDLGTTPSVSGVFEFGPDGLPSGMTGERFNDKGCSSLGAAFTATGEPSRECVSRSRPRLPGSSRRGPTPTRTGWSIRWSTTKAGQRNAAGGRMKRPRCRRPPSSYRRIRPPCACESTGTDLAASHCE